MPIEFRPKEERVAMTIRIPKSLAGALQRIAKKEGVSKVDALVSMLESAVREYETRRT